jgi:hypothetical protein
LAVAIPALHAIISNLRDWQGLTWPAQNPSLKETLMEEMPRDEASVEVAAETKIQYHKPIFRAFGTVRELTQTGNTGNLTDYISDYATNGYGT